MKNDNIVSKSQLRSLIQEITYRILKEINYHSLTSSNEKKELHVDEEKEEAYYHDAKDREDEYANVSRRLRMIDKAGLSQEYDQLMNGIFDHGIKEFDRRALAIAALEKKAEQLINQQVDRANTEDVKEETGTAAVSPITGPNAFKKKAMDEDAADDEVDADYKLNGRFVNRGEIKLEAGIDPKLAEEIANHHWDVFHHAMDERGVWNFKTRGDRWCCSVGLYQGQPAMLSVTTTPGRLQLLVGEKELFPLGEDIQEITTTGAVSGYNVPGFLSKRGGSIAGVRGSEKLGYTLTPAGQKEMNRNRDEL